MAGGVKEHSVFCMLCTSFAPPDEMMAVPPGNLGDALVAQQTEPVLFLPERQEVSFSGQVSFHFHVETFLKVRFPGRIKWVGCSPYERMPLDFHIDCSS